jgi:transposase-like protein
MSTKTPSDLNNLASEALDLWQEHLAALAADPKAKADLAQLIEPSRRLFAQWMEKAQTTANGTAPLATTEGTTEPVTTNGPETVRPESDDGALRIAQLTLHVAELEKRVTQLESRKRVVAAKTAATPPELD